MDDAEHISKQRAKELIESADFGSILVATIDQEPIPAIGTVPIEEREHRVESTMERYRFGARSR